MTHGKDYPSHRTEQLLTEFLIVIVTFTAPVCPFPDEQ
jgi:hypothetical protein